MSMLMPCRQAAFSAIAGNTRSKPNLRGAEIELSEKLACRPMAVMAVMAVIIDQDAKCASREAGH